MPGFYKTFEEYVLNQKPCFLPVIVEVTDGELFLEITVMGKTNRFRVNGSYIKNVNTPALIPGTEEN